MSPSEGTLVAFGVDYLSCREVFVPGVLLEDQAGLNPISLTQAVSSKVPADISTHTHGSSAAESLSSATLLRILHPSNCLSPSEILRDLVNVGLRAPSKTSALLFTGRSGSGKSFRVRELCSSVLYHRPDDHTPSTPAAPITSPPPPGAADSVIQTTRLASKLHSAMAILRYFGNARTVDNPDSSRFVLVIEVSRIESHRSSAIAEAQTSTFTATRSPQLHFSAAQTFRYFRLEAFALESTRATANDHHQGGLFHALESWPTPDRDGFHEAYLAEAPALQALEELFRPYSNVTTGCIGIIAKLLRCVKVINLGLRSRESTGSVREAVNEGLVAHLEKLLGMEEDTLLDWIDEVSGSGKEAKRLGRWRALGSGIYEIIFEFIIRSINQSLLPDCVQPAPGESKLSRDDVVVKLMDTFGVERVDPSIGKNHLNQFCINGFNDKLQEEYVTRRVRDVVADHLDQGLPQWIVDELMSHLSQDHLGTTDDNHSIGSENKSDGTRHLLDLVRQAIDDNNTNEGLLTTIDVLVRTLSPDPPSSSHPIDRAPKGISRESLEPGKLAFTHHFGTVEYDLEGWVADNHSAGIEALVPDSILNILDSANRSGSTKNPASASTKIDAPPDHRSRIQRNQASELDLVRHLGEELKVVHCLSAARRGRTTAAHGLVQIADWTDVEEQLICTGALGAHVIQTHGFSVRKPIQQVRSLLGIDDLDITDHLLSLFQGAGGGLTAFTEERATPAEGLLSHYVGTGKVFFKEQAWKILCDHVLARKFQLHKEEQERREQEDHRRQQLQDIVEQQTHQEQDKQHQANEQHAHHDQDRHYKQQQEPEEEEVKLHSQHKHQQALEIEQHQEIAHLLESSEERTFEQEQETREIPNPPRYLDQQGDEEGPDEGAQESDGGNPVGYDQEQDGYPMILAAPQESAPTTDPSTAWLPLSLLKYLPKIDVGQ